MNSGGPDDPELYGIGLDIYPLEKTASGLYRSNDGGKTAKRGAYDIHIDWHAMWIEPADPTHYMIGGDGGIGITRDQGGSYTFINRHAVGQFYAISFDRTPFFRVCGGLHNGTWCGPSRTKDSDGILHQDWFQVGGGDGFNSAQDPDDSDMIFYESQGGNKVIKSVNRGDKWVVISPDLSWQDLTRRFDRLVPSKTWVSRDLGRTFTPLMNGLPTGGASAADCRPCRCTISRCTRSNVNWWPERPGVPYG